MVVRYEDLAGEPEKSLVRICDFIGEPYPTRCSRFDGAPVFRDKGSNSSYGSRHRRRDLAGLDREIPERALAP